MWENTLLIFAGDNGGDCGLPAQPEIGIGGAPGACSNFPLLGRKCTSFEGGTRVAALVAGGLIPLALHGTNSTGLMCKQLCRREITVNFCLFLDTVICLGVCGRSLQSATDTHMTVACTMSSARHR
jgi:hypothetical protein